MSLQNDMACLLSPSRSRLSVKTQAFLVGSGKTDTSAAGIGILLWPLFIIVSYWRELHACLIPDSSTSSEVLMKFPG